jgi:hypothetical protein
LLRAEAKLGKCGLWATFNAPLKERLSSSARIYDKYHSSYCASVGLIDYIFAGDKESHSGRRSANFKIPEEFYETDADQRAFSSLDASAAVAAPVKVKETKPLDPNRSML